MIVPIAAGQATSHFPAADVTNFRTITQDILTKVQKAAADSPKQWRNYYWIAVGGQIVFIPLIFLLTGYWSPKRARQAEEEHEQMVQRELARLRG